jgi:hypothetical protein
MTVDETLDVDVLIVGSGPVGATFGRQIRESCPSSSIVMVDLGPHLGARAGIHVRNIQDEPSRVAAQILSQGPDRYRYDSPGIGQVPAASAGGAFVRPGTHLVASQSCEVETASMPSAALSSNVGGMGSHWSCISPRAGGSELIPLLPASTMDALYERAEELLQVSTRVYPSSEVGSAIQSRLAAALPELASRRAIGSMPLACQTNSNGRLHWTGSETILGDLAFPESAAASGFQVLSETLCRAVTLEGEIATGAVVEHLPTGQLTSVRAKAVAIAADALRTPQLLWSSGVRPTSLGHYLNDHPKLICAVNFDPSADRAVEAALGSVHPRPGMDDAVVGMFWVPFEDKVHPFHGEVKHYDLSRVALSSNGSAGMRDHVVALGWLCAKEIRFEDAVTFSDSEVDYLGMPKMRIDYSLTKRDRRTIEEAKQVLQRVASHLGKMRKGFDPLLLPAGSSIHYQGSVRMGDDRETSVCNSSSRVWGFRNLFVGGNGVIPTATACNPTLTSCALAVHASRAIAELI